MKVFLIVAILGEIVASVGPLPRDMRECWVHANKRQEATVKAIEQHWAVGIRHTWEGHTVTPQNVANVCLKSNKRPVLGEPWR
jgi:hypothetical protein